mgnify:FL=1
MNSELLANQSLNIIIMPWPEFDKWYGLLMAQTEAGTPGGCVVWTGCISPSTGYGAITVQWPGTPRNQRTMGVHRLMVMCALHTTELSAGHHASHLCHNKLCINPAHLSLEPQWVNNQRGNCIRQHRCLGHAGYPNCVLF